MFSITNILLIIVAYLLGSIPTAVWVGKIFYKKDIRKFGSKNAGAGIPVLIIDIFKGYAAVKLVHLSTLFGADNENLIIYQILLGIAAVIGHILPVYTGFRGGKGVATITGFVMAIHPAAALISLGLFIVILLLSDYVSVASLSAGIAFPILIIFIFESQEISLIVFSILVSFLLAITHKNNILRLLKGNESKAGLLKKKSKT